MQLVDRKTGKLVEVADEGAQAAFQSGKFGLPAGARLPVTTTAGMLGTVDAKDASSFLRRGANISSPKELHDAELEARIGGVGGTIAAGAAGVARGAVESFGIPYDAANVALAETLGGPEAAANMRENLAYGKEHNPLASFGGELAGMVGAGYVTGGRTALGGVGAAAERVLPRAAGSIVRGAARGVAEGGLLGGLNAIDEASLGDHELTAERVLTGVGHGALIGGVASGVLSGAGAALSAGKDAARDSAGRFLSRLRGEDIEALATRHFGASAEGLGEKVQKAYSKAAGVVSGKDTDVIERLTALTPEGADARRIAVFDAPKIQEQAALNIRTAGDSMLSAGQLVADEARGGLKADYVRKAIKTGNEAEAVTAAQSWLDKLITGSEAELAGDFAPQYAKSIESVSKSAYRAQAEIAEALASGVDVNAKTFIAIDGVKRDIQRLTASGHRSVLNISDPIEQRLAKRTVGWLTESASELRASLEDASLFGKAAEDQRAINAAWTKQIDASKRFHGSLTTDIGRDPANPYMNRRGIDPGKADTYVRGLVNPSNDLTHTAVKDYVRSTQELAEAIRTSYDLPEGKLAEVDRVHAAAKTFEKTIDGAEKTLVLANQYRHLTEGGGDGFAALAGTLGFGLGGLPGGVIGTAVGAVSSPGRAVAQMAAIERLASKVKGEVSDGIRSFMSGGGKPKASIPASTQIFQGTKGEPQKVVFERSVREVQRLAANPQEQAARVAKSMGDMGKAAPKTAIALARLAVVATQYLSDHAPPGFASRPGLIPTHDAMYSDDEMGEWARRAAAVNDYRTVLASLKAGHVSPEEIDVMKNIYPKEYALMRADVLERLASQKSPLPYGKRVELAILFDASADETLDGDFIAAIQESFATPEAPDAAMGQAPSAKPKAIDMSESAKISATVSQDIEGRDRP